MTKRSCSSKLKLTFSLLLVKVDDVLRECDVEWRLLLEGCFSAAVFFQNSLAKVAIFLENFVFRRNFCSDHCLDTVSASLAMNFRAIGLAVAPSVSTP